MIDLHCHSNCSDGILTPEALFEKAKISGITILALTDHDTVAGVRILRNMPPSQSITLINGIELSTRWKKYEIHILGYHMDIEHEALQTLIRTQQENRLLRAKLIAKQLAAIGITDAFEKACTIAGHERIGRPHFAKLLVNAGKVPDLQDAFKRYLGRGKPAYVMAPWISVEEAVSHIHQAQGLAVIAHPLKYGLTNTKLHELLSQFKVAGGDGLEVVSGEINQTEIQQMAGLCARFNLLASTGSDYHGEGVSRVNLGCQKPLPATCKPIWQQWTM